MNKLVNEESYFNLIGQEPCNPRDIFLDYKEMLEENKRKMKKMFLEILRLNLDSFHIDLTFEEFTDLLFSFEEFKEFCKKEVVNSPQETARYFFNQVPSINWWQQHL